MAEARAKLDVTWFARIVRGQDRRPLVVLVLIASLATANARVVAQTCVGDCNGNDRVEVNELVIGVNIALDTNALTDCPSLDNGEGEVTVDRLVVAVTNLLNSCSGSPTPGQGTSTPTPTATPTPGTASPTVTPTSQASVSMWTVDDYDIEDSDCAGVLEDSVQQALEDRGPDYIVRRSGDQVEIEDSEDNTMDGTVDPDGTVHVQVQISDSIATCDYDVDIDASANLNESPTTATYSADVNLSGFCLGLDDCSVEITARWRRLDGTSSGIVAAAQAVR